MKYKIKMATIWSMLTVLFMPITAFANSAPVYMEQHPSLGIALMEDSPIAVDKEKLTFVIDQQSSNEAMVTAEYILSNTSQEKMTVPMIFPFVSDGYRGFDPKIQFNGKIVDYKVFGAGYVDVRDYLEDPHTFKEQVDINKIIKNLNKPIYQPKYFNDALDNTLYEIKFEPPTERQSHISFNIDPEKTRVLVLGFMGFEINNDGYCVVSSYVSEKSLGKTGYILVLGEDTLTNIKGNHEETIEKSTVVIKDFIKEEIVHGEDTWYQLGNRDVDDYYGRFVKEIDDCFKGNQLSFSDSMIIENMMYKNNISALLYEVEFEGRSTNNLTVNYPMRATIDRRKTKDYINTFSYIINPAKSFSEFGEIDIHIQLNTKSPYIIKSSIPLNKAEKGIYTMSVNGLPEEDLIFSTYAKEKITFLDSMVAKVFPRSYEIIFIGFMITIPCFIGMLIGIFLSMKKKMNNL